MVAVANAGDGSVRLFQGENLTSAGVISLGGDADNVRRDLQMGRLVIAKTLRLELTASHKRGMILMRLPWLQRVIPVHLSGFKAGPARTQTMSDDEQPTWAQMTEEQLGAAAETRYHCLTKVRQAILDSDARVLRHLDEICDGFPKPPEAA